MFIETGKYLFQLDQIFSCTSAIVLGTRHLKILEENLLLPLLFIRRVVCLPKDCCCVNIEFNSQNGFFLLDTHQLTSHYRIYFLRHCQSSAFKTMIFLIRWQKDQSKQEKNSHLIVEIFDTWIFDTWIARIQKHLFPDTRLLNLIDQKICHSNNIFVWIILSFSNTIFYLLKQSFR